MASREQTLPPHTTVNISDAIVLQNKSEVPIFWANDSFTNHREGNELKRGQTIALATAGVFVRNDTCFSDIAVHIETKRP